MSFLSFLKERLSNQPNDKTVKDILIDTKKFLLSKEWHQGSYSNSSKTSFCLLGALDQVAESTLEKDAADTVIRKLVVSEMGPNAGIVSWNDKEGRTKQEVLALLDKAIAKAP